MSLEEAETMASFTITHTELDIHNIPTEWVRNDTSESFDYRKDTRHTDIGEIRNSTNPSEELTLKAIVSRYIAQTNVISSSDLVPAHVISSSDLVAAHNSYEAKRRNLEFAEISAR